NDRVRPGKLGDQRPPHVTVLRVAVQEDDGCVFAGDQVVNLYSVDAGDAALDGGPLWKLGHEKLLETAYGRSNKRSSLPSARALTSSVATSLACAPSPARSASPSNATAPRTTCSQAFRPLGRTCETVSSLFNSAAKISASWCTVTEPSRPS